MSVNLAHNPGPSGVCSNRPNPYYIQGAVLNMLTWHFSLADNIQEPVLKQYIWAPDNQATQQITSKILITPLTKWDVKQLQARPALVISRDDLQSRTEGIGDNLQAIQTPIGTVDAALHATAGHASREYPCDLGITIFCLSHDGAAAELLGWEVFTMLAGWANRLEHDLNLHQFKVHHMGKPGRLLEAKEHWAVPVRCAVNFRVKHIIRSGAPILKAIVPTLDAAC